jgi:hypothetical protein
MSTTEPPSQILFYDSSTGSILPESKRQRPLAAEHAETSIRPAYRPEQYTGWSRVFLEGFLTLLYVVFSLSVEIWHEHDPAKFPFVLVPLVEATIQLFILYNFYSYGVGYLNPLTVLGALFVDMIRGEKNSESLPLSIATTPHHLDFAVAVLMMVSELCGAAIGGVLVFGIFYGTMSGEYGFSAVDYTSLAPIQWIVIWTFGSFLMMLPKLIAAVKRHTLAGNMALTVAGAYTVAIALMNKGIITWMVSAVLSNVGGSGWLSPEAADGVYVFIGQLCGMAFSVVVIVMLPRRKAEYGRRKLE